jgi:glycosyltransferase involved in cell wall biosynthesis
MQARDTCSEVPLSAKAGMSLPVSLIVPCYERHGQTRDLLRSLAAANARCEIIIVDDASPHPLDSLVSEFSELDVKYVRNNKNAGPAYSRNLGIASAQHDLVAFTDNDVCRQRMVVTYISFY